MPRAKPGRRRGHVEEAGLGLFLAAVLGLLFFVTPSPGVLGATVQRALSGGLGAGAVVLLLGLLALGLGMLRTGTLPRISSRALGLVALAALVPAWQATVGAGGGILGRALATALGTAVGSAGRAVVLAAGALLALLGTFGVPVGEALRAAERLAGAAASAVRERLTAFLFVEVVDEPAARERRPPPEPEEEMEPVLAEEEPPPPAPEPAVESEPAELGPAPGAELPVPQGGYRLPPLSLLRRPEGQRPNGKDAEARARLLVDTLQSFGVSVRVSDMVQGPAVTRFEVQPAPGVKVSRIVALADDIALAMAATDVRIEAPIPGKSAVGIEIPNPEVAPVRLREVLESPAFREATSPLTVALGKDIAGRPIVAALDRMPHLLIAGATGSGKSVCINAILCSLLFRATPERVRLLLVDPKVVELTHFAGIPHLLAPVVTEARKAAGVLRGVLREMEERYERFARAGVRDIVRYNQTPDGQLAPLPYIVVVIDELADLMMVAPAEVEDAICRLAQLARAAGIHLVVATQRPSVDVITGLIKANIPSRLAFAVSSQVDSRTILDQAGAEKLLGKGDMLFHPLGRAKPIRAQGVYVSDEEIEGLVAFWRTQGTPQFEERIVQAASEVPEEREEQVDELFPEAVRIVVEARQASASLLQRRMRVGYSRAARLIDQMEERGIVGPADGAKPREVRITAQDLVRLLGEVPRPKA